MTIRILAISSIRQAVLSILISSVCLGTSVSEKEGLKLGMEIELTGEQVLASVFRYMEFTDEPGIKNRLKPFLTNEILDLSLTPETFSKLPPQIQAKLSEGVVQGGTLSKPISEMKIQAPPDSLKPQGSLNIGVSGLLGADGKPISSSSPQIVLPNSVGGKLERTGSGIIVPEGTQKLPQSADASKAAWSTITERWKKMSRDEKLPLIAANDLPKDVVAVLYKGGKLRPDDFIRRADLPAPIADLMDRLEWVPDLLGPLEFRHKVPVTDPEVLKKDIETFSKMVGIHRFMTDPTKPEPDVYGFSFHVHVSKKGANAKLVGELLNRIRLLELDEQGRSDAAFSSNMGYSLRADQKGLIRVVSADRIEGRVHTVGYKEEVDKLVNDLSRPIAEIEQALKDELQAKMANLFKKIESLTTGSAERQAAIRVMLAINPVFRFPEEMSEDVAKAIRDFPYFSWMYDNLADDIASIRYSGKYPNVVWKKEIDALKNLGFPKRDAIQLNFMSRLISRLEETAQLLDNLPCGEAFELLPTASTRFVF